MTFEAAILAALRDSDRPMSTREVADTVIKSGGVSIRGQTPDATVSAILYRLARNPETTGVRRQAVQGKARAKRGSVRWVWVRT